MKSFEEVIEQIEKNRSETEDLLRKLVNIETVVPPGNNYEKSAYLVGEFLEGMECKVNIFETPESYLEKS